MMLRKAEQGDVLPSPGPPGTAQRLLEEAEHLGFGSTNFLHFWLRGLGCKINKTNSKRIGRKSSKCYLQEWVREGSWAPALHITD